MFSNVSAPPHLPMEGHGSTSSAAIVNSAQILCSVPLPLICPPAVVCIWGGFQGCCSRTKEAKAGFGCPLSIHLLLVQAADLVNPLDGYFRKANKYKLQVLCALGDPSSHTKTTRRILFSNPKVPFLKLPPLKTLLLDEP